MPGVTRLTADDWTAAAVETLLAEGPDAVAVQPLARRLGATKGSFYWHFETRGDLLRAALDRWLEDATAEIIAEVAAATDDPGERARLFLRALSEHALDNPGQLRLLAAADQPDVQAALEDAARTRIDHLARLLRTAGHTRAVAQRRATLAYATHLGHAQLAYAAPDLLPAGPRARRALLDEQADLLIDG